jgi:hypothetical protein
MRVAIGFLLAGFATAADMSAGDDLVRGAPSPTNHQPAPDEMVLTNRYLTARTPEAVAEFFREGVSAGYMSPGSMYHWPLELMGQLTPAHVLLAIASLPLLEGRARDTAALFILGSERQQPSAVGERIRKAIPLAEGQRLMLGIPGLVSLPEPSQLPAARVARLAAADGAADWLDGITALSSTSAEDQAAAAQALGERVRKVLRDRWEDPEWTAAWAACWNFAQQHRLLNDEDWAALLERIPETADFIWNEENGLAAKIGPVLTASASATFALTGWAARHPQQAEAAARRCQALVLAAERMGAEEGWLWHTEAILLAAAQSAARLLPIADAPVEQSITQVEDPLAAIRYCAARMSGVQRPDDARFIASLLKTSCQTWQSIVLADLAQQDGMGPGPQSVAAILDHIGATTREEAPAVTQRMLEPLATRSSEDAAVIVHLIARLSDTSQHVRYSAARALTYRGQAAAAAIEPAMAALLKHSDSSKFVHIALLDLIRAAASRSELIERQLLELLAEDSVWYARTPEFGAAHELRQRVLMVIWTLGATDAAADRLLEVIANEVDLETVVYAIGACRSVAGADVRQRLLPWLIKRMEAGPLFEPIAVPTPQDEALSATNMLRELAAIRAAWGEASGRLGQQITFFVDPPYGIQP